MSSAVIQFFVSFLVVELFLETLDWLCSQPFELCLQLGKLESTWSEIVTYLDLSRLAAFLMKAEAV